MITEMTMGKQEHRVSVDNGKYTFVSEGFGVIDILRGGQPWHSQWQAANALHAMMCELDAARAVVQAVRRYVAANIGNLCPKEIFDAIALHDSLTSDREPPSAWCGEQASAPSQTDSEWIPPSQRVPEPGPCTPMAHCWGSGSAVCQCGESTRDGDCRGWCVASRLTDDQIYEAVTGRSKIAAASHVCNCAGGDAGGHDLDCKLRDCQP